MLIYEFICCLITNYKLAFPSNSYGKITQKVRYTRSSIKISKYLNALFSKQNFILK